MQSILAKLNKTNGIRGSMIVNRDGIVVASDFAVEIDETSVGAVASSILSALENALRRVAMGKFSRFIITGSENKLALVDSGQTLLLVLLNRDINMGMVNLEIKEALAAVKEKSKMS